MYLGHREEKISNSVMVNQLKLCLNNLNAFWDICFTVLKWILKIAAVQLDNQKVHNKRKAF